MLQSELRVVIRWSHCVPLVAGVLATGSGLANKVPAFAHLVPVALVPSGNAGSGRLLLEDDLGSALRLQAWRKDDEEKKA